MISIFSARTYSESVVVDERLPYFISWIWKSGNILFVINILAFILCWGPIAFGLDVIDPEPLPRSHETYTALVASVAVAAPLSIDLFLDMWASYWTSNYAIKNVGIPRIVLILSLWLPDLCMLCIAMPLMNVSLLLCLFKSRSVLLLYGIFGHFWKLDQFFQSRLVFSSYILLTTSGVIGAYAGFYPVSSRIASSWVKNFYFYFAGLGVVLFIYFAFQWGKKMRNISYKNMTSNEMSASVFITSFILILLSYIATANYYGEVTSLTIIALQSRIIQNEIQIKENLLNMKRNFVRFVSHEIRTPLNSVCMGLDLIHKEMVKDGCGMEGLQTLSDVKEAVGISLDILNDLLSYEKLEAGIMVIEPIKFRASFLISDFMRPFVMQARRLEVDLQLPVEDSETFSLLRDTVLYADKNRLGQVLRNLVSNALKFTPRNGIIQVQACRIRDSIVHKDGSSSGIQDLLRISVVDSGAGISKENIKKLFNEIIQFHPGKLQNGGGSGLGLWITKAIVDLHRGRIFVESAGEGAGCTFTLDLPISQITEDDSFAFETNSDSNVPISPGQVVQDLSVHRMLHTDDKEGVRRGDVEEENGNHSKQLIISDRVNLQRVLVVDDAPMNRKMLCRLLAAKFSTKEAEDGAVAVSNVLDAMGTRRAFDAVLMDHLMPNMDGPTAARTMRDAGYNGVIVGISGNAQADDMVYFKDHGADKVMVKPVNISELETYLLSRKTLR